MKKREFNYDLLRIISTIAVIAIHASASPVISLDKSEHATSYILISLFYNAMSRFAVPCFIMMTGAFDLANDRNGDYKFFYKKILCNIGIPVAIFSVLYMLQTEYSLLPKVIGGADTTILIEPIKSFIRGNSSNHLWYVYTMIFVWLLVPVIINFKKQIGEKNFRRVALVFFVIAYFSIDNQLKPFIRWDIGYSLYFVGYLMIGYVLRTSTLEKKSNLKGVILILLGIVAELGLLLVRYMQVTKRITNLERNPVEPMSPIVIIASILLFLGFSYLNINRGFGSLPKHTFVIYLVHMFFLNFVKDKIISDFYTTKVFVSIPLLIVSTFLASWIFAIIYNKLWDKIDGKLQISSFICKTLKLN